MEDKRGRGKVKGYRKGISAKPYTADCIILCQGIGVVCKRVDAQLVLLALNI